MSIPAKADVASFYQGLQSQLPHALSASRILHAYEGFVTKNSSSVSQIESALRSLTYIIPGRFREAEIASESLHAGVQLLSMYHDSLLSHVYAQLPDSIPRAFAAPHQRYTKFWCRRSLAYRRIATLLQTIQYTELLCEMLAKRRGEKARWRMVVTVEFIKAVCRFLLMSLTKSRPLVSPPLPERELDPRLPLDSIEEPPPDDAIHSSNDADWAMPRTGLTLPSLPDSGDVLEYLLKKVLTADDVKAPKQLLHRLTTLQGQTAEALWILRPLVYAILLQRYQKNKKSWTPWLVGTVVELVSRELTKSDLSGRLAGGLRGLTHLEKEELKKRGSCMGWWLMRSAFYEQITRRWVGSLVATLQDKPLLDLMSGIIEDYAFLWDEYYFSTATM